jgi:signal transduction histidine kinase
MSKRGVIRVVSFTEILEVNWIILYFVYGQVFFITGLVTVLQWRRRSDLELARTLPWLAAFGIAHGLNEWGYIFIPLQALYLEDSVVRLMVIAHLLLLAVSFFFLFQFGIELVLPMAPRQRWIRALPVLALLAWAGGVAIRGVTAQESLNILFAIGDGWSRYVLALPGAILSSVGLLRQARQVRAMNLSRIPNYLTGAAIAFLIYAIVGGLIVPTAPTFPANRVNYALLDEMIHVPAPVFRSICGLAIAFFVMRSLEVFQVETEERIAEMEQAQILAADRERIGRELHDGIIQNIYAGGLSLEDALHLVEEDPPLAKVRIQAVMSILNRTIEDIRRYIFDLRAAARTRALETILEELVEDLRLDTFLEVDLEVVGQRCCWLGPQTVAHVTQVAREALSNVVQHGEATHVTVNLTYTGHTTELGVKDNGRGVDLDELLNNGRMGEGLTNIQTRAHLMNAVLDLSSQPGEGFQLSLTIPCGGSQDVQQIDDGVAVGKRELPVRGQDSEQEKESSGLEAAVTDNQPRQGPGS